MSNETPVSGARNPLDSRFRGNDGGENRALWKEERDSWDEERSASEAELASSEAARIALEVENTHLREMLRRLRGGE